MNRVLILLLVIVNQNYTIQLPLSLCGLLKVRKVSAERVCMFREFHTLGAATGKARKENTVVAGGCCSSKAEADRRFLVCCHQSHSFWIKYAPNRSAAGALPQTKLWKLTALPKRP